MVYDHKGNGYDSIIDMCEVYGIYTTTYYRRLNKYGDKEYALTGRKIDSNGKEVINSRKIISAHNSKKVYDHKGNEYSSIKEMCKAYNVCYDIYNTRRSRGWSLERALTGDDARRYNRKKIKDHNGVEYDSIIEMCKAHSADYGLFRARYRNGWTIEEALTGKRHENK